MPGTTPQGKRAAAEVTHERHPGHTESEPLEETLSRLLNGHWDALDLDGPVIRVDTELQASDHLVDAIVEQIRQNWSVR